MLSSMIQSEVIARDLSEPISIQLDEDHHVLYVLNGYHLSRIALNDSNTNPQVVYQHNRKLLGTNTNSEDDDENYSQGESDDERDNPRVTDPNDDSEPSTDDDEESIADRRNWRRHAWRTYRLDNACSMLFLPAHDQLVVLNEGVITFLSIAMEDGRPFVQGPSKNIFCYEYNAIQKKSIQPWSIAPTSTDGFFIFSLLDSAQLYILDVRQDNAIIETFVTVPISYCPYLLFHSQRNILLVYDANQVWAVSLVDKTINQLFITELEKEKAISAMAIDKHGYIYILSGSIILKYQWQYQLQLLERLENVEFVPSANVQLIVSGTGDELFLSNIDTNCIYRWKKKTT